MLKVSQLCKKPHRLRNPFLITRRPSSLSSSTGSNVESINSNLASKWHEIYSNYLNTDEYTYQDQLEKIQINLVGTPVREEPRIQPITENFLQKYCDTSKYYVRPNSQIFKNLLNKYHYFSEFHFIKEDNEEEGLVTEKMTVVFTEKQREILDLNLARTKSCFGDEFFRVAGNMIVLPKIDQPFDYEMTVACLNITFFDEEKNQKCNEFTENSSVDKKIANSRNKQRQLFEEFMKIDPDNDTVILDPTKLVGKGIYFNTMESMWIDKKNYDMKEPEKKKIKKGKINRLKTENDTVQKNESSDPNHIHYDNENNRQFLLLKSGHKCFISNAYLDVYRIQQTSNAKIDPMDFNEKELYYQNFLKYDLSDQVIFDNLTKGIISEGIEGLHFSQENRDSRSSLEGQIQYKGKVNKRVSKNQFTLLIDEWGPGGVDLPSLYRYLAEFGDVTELALMNRDKIPWLFYGHPNQDQVTEKYASYVREKREDKMWRESYEPLWAKDYFQNCPSKVSADEIDSDNNDDSMNINPIFTKETIGLGFRLCFSDDDNLSAFRQKYYHFVNGRQLRIIDQNTQKSFNGAYENYMVLRKARDYVHDSKTSILEFPQSHQINHIADYFDPLKDIYGDELSRLQRKQYNEDREKIDYWSKKIAMLTFLRKKR